MLVLMGIIREKNLLAISRGKDVQIEVVPGNIES